MAVGLEDGEFHSFQARQFRIVNRLFQTFFSLRKVQSNGERNQRVGGFGSTLSGERTHPSGSRIVSGRHRFSFLVAHRDDHYWQTI